MPLANDLLSSLVENSQLFLHDVFTGTDQLLAATTQTGAISYALANIQLSTGVLANSTARLSYADASFNIMHGRALVKLRFSDFEDVFAFFGFCENIDTPSLTMTSSHAGFFVSEKKMYWSCGNGDPSYPRYQNTLITQLDPSREIIYDFQGKSGRWFPLPLIIPQFDEFIVKDELRKWSNQYSNGSAPPDDKLHYFILYIKNTTGYTRTCNLLNFTYAEDYPD